MSEKRKAAVGSPDVYVPVHQRRRQKVISRRRGARGTTEQQDADEEAEQKLRDDPYGGPSLLELTLETKDPDANEQELAAEALAMEEAEILEAVTSFKPLITASEHAHGQSYTLSLKTDWMPCSWYAKLTEKFGDQIWTKTRAKYRILVEGEQIPPPVLRFTDLKLPHALLRLWKGKGIVTPSPIQMQALPVILSGRDTIGVAYTGSGKTIAFCTPLVCLALGVELADPVRGGEGPIGLVLCPSRELADQTYQVCCEMADAIRADGGPQLRSALCIGGVSMREQSQAFREGVHIIIATPGRLLHQLNEKMVGLDRCRYLCFDEADRLIDLGFEEPVRDIMSFFHHQRQMVLFSATMPMSISQFAKTALVNPVIVNVGRAGAANKNVRQVVEYVEKDEKITQLLRVIAPIPPPVLIFADNQRDVEDIYQYLVTKGLKTCCIHGGLRQEERARSVDLFKRGKKDILVSTDVGAKGLDFPLVQHVINFDMPREIENYVHRIGRTGRGGAKGVATTFINSDCEELILLDLRQLLIEAKQEVPEGLMNLGPPVQEGGCQYCGGLGHRIMDCPKLEGERKKALGAATSAAATGGSY